MLSAIFNGLEQGITAFAEMLGNVFGYVSQLFIEPGNVEGTYQVTFIGTLVLLAVGAGLIWLVYRLVKNAVRGIGR